MELVLDILVYLKTLLGEHKLRFRQTIAFLSCRGVWGSNSSPIAIRVPGTAATSQSIPQGELDSIYADFDELLSHNESLGNFCVESIDRIMNRAMVKESQKAGERADDQKRLTTLAYFFLPLSLVSFIFDMNVREFGTGSQHIWLPATIFSPHRAIRTDPLASALLQALRG